MRLLFVLLLLLRLLLLLLQLLLLCLSLPPVVLAARPRFLHAPSLSSLTWTTRSPCTLPCIMPVPPSLRTLWVASLPLLLVPLLARLLLQFCVILDTSSATSQWLTT